MGLVMANDQNIFSDPSNLLSAWMKTATDFWGATLKVWTGPAKDREDSSASDSQNKSRAQESLETVLKTWQTLSKVAHDPGTSEAFSNFSHTMPDILQKIIQASWQGLFHVQQQWLEKTGKIEQSTQAYSFENIDKNTFKIWTDIYENNFKQFLHIPQLGLTRFYQEKINQATDNYNQFQAAFGEFMYLFCLPMEKSFKVLQDEVAKMAEEGTLKEDYNTYYRLWIKILEGHYMNLFKSAEYVQAMGRTLDTLQEYLKVRDAIIQDWLKAMAMPTQTDLDDLYKEMHQLKKRIRKLEKKS